MANTKFRLKREWKVRCGNETFEKPEGAYVTIDQVDQEQKKVLVNFGGGHVDWFDAAYVKSYLVM